MNKTIIIIIVLVLAGIGAYYFINNGSNGAPTYTNTATTNSNTNTPVPTTPSPTNPTPITPVSKTPTPSSVIVNIKNFAFSPSSLTIKAGTKVTWTNNDSAPHTVTSDSGSLLNSATLSPGQSFSFTFTNTGSVNYHCSIHPMMKGTITVTK